MDDSGREAALLETPRKPKAGITTKTLRSAFCFVFISVYLHFASDFCLQECFVLSGR